MEDGRRNLQFIAVKTYYRPKELVEMLDATEKDIHLHGPFSVQHDPYGFE